MAQCCGILGILTLTTLLGVSAVSSCGYQTCPTGKPDHLNVHIICHTHDDVGWLHTADTYYDMWVRDIISSVVGNLLQDPNRKFSYVESAFFWMWWQEQTELVKMHVKQLVENGRLEFVSGGWSMNDEATTHYLAIIDQMTLGLRFLNDTFGKCASPKVGWQVDTFGHSREQASLFAQMQFDGQFLGRVHYQDKKWREQTQTMEFMWNASESLGKKAYLFTGILPNVYWPPKGFCFDIFCTDEELTDDNIQAKSHNFITTALDQSKNYATNHIVMTMGMDFQYRDAAKWYRNLDFLISHVNSLQAVGVRVNVFYSTPSCYLYSLSQSNMTWPTMKDDFFPYASKQHEYWTGFFTSRPSLKFDIRRANAFFQICKQLVTLSNIKNTDVSILARALGVAQHHDAITGTEKQHVSDDYTFQLAEGTAACQNSISESLKKLLFKNETSYLESEDDYQKIYFCSALNISQCDFTEGESEFFVVVYNSLGHRWKSFIRFPVMGEGYRIRQITKRRRNISVQILPIHPAVINLPERTSFAVNELVFPVTLRPLSISVYSVEMMQNFVPVNDIESERIPTSIEDAFIKNEILKVVIDAYSGLMKEIVLLQTNKKLPISQSFYYYEGTPGYRIERASGAYAFNPQFDMAFSLGENITYRVFKGPLVEEVHQYYNRWISQVIRIYKGQPYIEFDWVVGPIPVNDHIGREIISRFDSNLQTNGTFYTDSNCRETLKRIRNYQENWPWNRTENIAGNYYPVTSWISIQDEAQDLKLTVFTDRSEGGSSITDGSIELMVHRRLLFDDGFGVNEALNEAGYNGRGLVVRGKHYLTLGTIGGITRFNKHFAKRIFHYPLPVFIRQNSTAYSDRTFNEFRGLKSSLPKNVHLLTLEKLSNGEVLIRFEHFYEKDDDRLLSGKVTISLTKLFLPFRILYYRETSLSANQYLNETERLKWSYVGQELNMENIQERSNATSDVMSNEVTEETTQNIPADDGMSITLGPMDIRTFIVKVKYNN